MVCNDVIKIYELEIGSVCVYDNYMIAQLNEGITLTLERVFELIGISEVHFRGRNFAYITIRNNSYAVDPTVYTHLQSLANLKAIAIVSKKDIDKQNFKIEKHFYGNNTMQLFKELEDALIWVKSMLSMS